jgi:hypothetical protein
MLLADTNHNFGSMDCHCVIKGKKRGEQKAKGYFQVYTCVVKSKATFRYAIL